MDPLGEPIRLLIPFTVDGVYCSCSAYGPLGATGPIGHHLWNPTAWRWPDHREIEDQPTPILFEHPDNPLSSAGPLSYEAYHVALPSINDFGKHLQGLGLWGVLGPLGPLGGLGPLGALGPTGPYNTMNLEGHHTIPVRWNKTNIRYYDLVEVLDESHVKQPLDCSFMIFGQIRRRYKVDSYYFDCEPNQFITIVLVPEQSIDHFNITLYSAGNDTETKVASSQSANLINFIQLAFSNTDHHGSFRLDVSLHDHDSFLSFHTYRLIVTGSHDLLDLNEENGNIQGPHIITCNQDTSVD